MIVSENRGVRMEKKIYHTEQRKQLLAFLQEHKTEQYSIDEMIALMDPENMPGKSTVYRLMKQLVEEGIVKRSNKENTRQFVYQLLEGKQCSHHFHLQCENCGKLFHLKEEETEQVKGMLQLQDKFHVDVSNACLWELAKTVRKTFRRKRRINNNIVATLEGVYYEKIKFVIVCNVNWMCLYDRMWKENTIR